MNWLSGWFFRSRIRRSDTAVESTPELKRRSGRFEPEVHLGILAIIVILLLINLLSNWSLQRFRLQLESDANTSLREISLVLSRQMEPEQLIVRPATNWHQETPLTVQLALLTRLLPGQKSRTVHPELGSDLTRSLEVLGYKVDSYEIEALLRDLPAGETRQLAERLIVYQNQASLPGKKGSLILIAEIPVLSELNRWSSRIMYASIIGLVLILIIYVVLMRRITQPIRELTTQAAQAGRSLDKTLDPATAIVQDYQQLVAELQDRERKLVEANAALSEEAYRLSQIHAYALRSMSRGMLVIGEQNQIIALNPAAEELFARSNLTLQQGSDASEILSLFPNWASHLHDAREATTAIRRLEVIRQERGMRTIELVASSVNDNQGRRLGVGVVLSDLTDELLAADEHARQERLSSLGEMAAGLAHQLRNSLGAIRGFASLIKRRTPVEAQSHLEQLLTEERQAEDLIGRFLSLSRPLASRSEAISPQKIVHDIVLGFQDRAHEVGVVIRVESLLPEESLLQADHLLIKQALSNLVDNALHHTPSGGAITIGLSRYSSNRQMCLSVRDTGVGISDDTKAKLFTPFFSTRASGTGLGLAFVRKVIELHRGEMKIESEMGKGTVVQLLLPIESSQAGASLPGHRSSASGPILVNSR